MTWSSVPADYSSEAAPQTGKHVRAVAPPRQIAILSPPALCGAADHGAKALAREAVLAADEMPAGLEFADRVARSGRA